MLLEINTAVSETGLPNGIEIEDVLPDPGNVSVKACTLLACFMYCACVFGLLVLLYCSRFYVFCVVSVQGALSVVVGHGLDRTGAGVLSPPSGSSRDSKD